MASFSLTFQRVWRGEGVQVIQQECRLADISQPRDAWSDAPPNAGVKRGWVGVGGVDHVHRLSFDLYLWSSFIGG